VIDILLSILQLIVLPFVGVPLLAYFVTSLGTGFKNFDLLFLHLLLPGTVWNVASFVFGVGPRTLGNVVITPFLIGAISGLVLFTACLLSQKNRSAPSRAVFVQSLRSCPPRFF
jgi:hypothetical protein